MRLPKSFRFPESLQEVIVRKSGKRVILEPADDLSEEFMATLGAWDEEIERLPRRKLKNLKDPFDCQFRHSRCRTGSSRHS